MVSVGVEGDSNLNEFPMQMYDAVFGNLNKKGDG
jgi:hypothetical protein